MTKLVSILKTAKATAESASSNYGKLAAPAVVSDRGLHEEAEATSFRRKRQLGLQSGGSERDRQDDTHQTAPFQAVSTKSQ